jgi:hypothetical protein
MNTKGAEHEHEGRAAESATPNASSRGKNCIAVSREMTIRT